MQYRTRQVGLARHGDQITAGAGRVHVQFQQAAAVERQVAIDGQGTNGVPRGQGATRQHRGIAQRTTTAQQAAIVHGKGHTIHGPVHNHAAGIHRGIARHGVISRENIITGAVLDQIAGAGDHAVIEVVVGAVDFQGAGSVRKQHIPHDGACVAPRAQRKVRAIIK